MTVSFVLQSNLDRLDRLSRLLLELFRDLDLESEEEPLSLLPDLSLERDLDLK